MRRRGSFLAGLLVAGAIAALAAFAGLGSATTKASPPANTSSPSISGTPADNNTLTASPGSWSGDTPMSFSYQWLQCDSSGSGCGNISGADEQTYRVSSHDTGHTLRVSVTASNSAGVSGAISSATAVVGSTSSSNSGDKPAATSQPNITGNAQVGQTLTSQSGAWQGKTPMSFSYQWQRCSTSGADCKSIDKATGQTYVVQSSDAGYRLRTIVTAKNDDGTGTVTSNLTGTIAGSGDRPKLAKPPIVSGSAQIGATLTTTAGSWTSSTAVRFSYDWTRCDTNGNNCDEISGANGVQYKVTNDDQGHTLRARVTATNSAGSVEADSAQTATVGGNAPSTSSGPAVAVSSLSPPDRLVVSGVRFSPSKITTRQPFTALFRVTDQHGRPVQGALVYVVTLPYGIVAKAPEATTGGNGYASFVLRPTSKLQLKRGAIVMFVRARKPGDPLLSGISTRRLVQVVVR
ncbi:MAG TPA: hypothetical protein VF186_00335 [Gaiellaceae bacterium]